jgi:outer membrane receptor for ferrienterochelin and colicin
VLLDGRATVFELHSITMWETLEVTLSQVERIEVVRGPGSALYGANAFDGVISIITKRPTGDNEIDIAGFRGDFGERGANVGARTTWGALRLDGFLSTGESEVQNSPSTIVPAALKATNDFTKGGVRVGWSNPQGVDLEVSGGISHGESLSYYHYSFGTFAEQLRNGYGQVRYTHPQLFAEATLTAQLYHNTRQGTVDGWNGSTSHAELMLDRSFGAEHRVIAGAVARKVSSGQYSILDQDRSHLLPGVYLQDAWTIAPRWELTSGVRLDHHPDAGSKLSPRATVLFKPTPSQTLRASVGQAFRNPTLVENHLLHRFSLAPGLEGEITGSEDLRPEEITSYELGYVRALGSRSSFTADLFVNHLDNPVRGTAVSRTMRLPNGFEIPIAWHLINGPSSTAAGGEVSATTTPRDWLRAHANYSFVRLEQEGGLRMHLAPEHMVNTEVAVRPIPPLWLDLTWHYTSETNFASELDAPTTARVGQARLPARGIFHLNARASLGRNIAASAFVQNLTDHAYYDVVGGELQGRRLVGKVTYSF